MASALALGDPDDLMALSLRLGVFALLVAVLLVLLQARAAKVTLKSVA